VTEALFRRFDLREQGQFQPLPRERDNWQRLLIFGRLARV
jgi:hypothetical protein